MGLKLRKIETPFRLEKKGSIFSNLIKLETGSNIHRNKKHVPQDSKDIQRIWLLFYALKTGKPIVFLYKHFTANKQFNILSVVFET